MPESKIKSFVKELNKYKVKREPDPYGDRYTYCHLIYMKEVNGVNFPLFEVRGWGKNEDGIHVDLVNWTVAAGTCSVVLKADNIDDWKILEDEPTLQVLYGRK